MPPTGRVLYPGRSIRALPYEVITVITVDF